MAGNFLTEHLTTHVIAMSLLAPLLAIYAHRHGKGLVGDKGLMASTVCQMTLLWAWYLPSSQNLALGGGLAASMMHLSLFGASLWFWMGIVAATCRGEWEPLVALLVTGSLFCLLGALLVFAPQPIYAAMVHTGHLPSAELLLDQRLAGLAILTVCPLVHLMAAVVAGRRWLRRARAETDFPMEFVEVETSRGRPLQASGSARRN